MSTGEVGSIPQPEEAETFSINVSRAGLVFGIVVGAVGMFVLAAFLDFSGFSKERDDLFRTVFVLAAVASIFFGGILGEDDRRKDVLFLALFLGLCAAAYRADLFGFGVHYGVDWVLGMRAQ
jgi:hypothetical protein